MHTTLVVSVAISVLVLSSAGAQKPPAMQEWPAYAGDAGAHPRRLPISAARTSRTFRLRGSGNRLKT